MTFQVTGRAKKYNYSPSNYWLPSVQHPASDRHERYEYIEAHEAIPCYIKRKLNHQPSAISNKKKTEEREREKENKKKTYAHSCRSVKTTDRHLFRIAPTVRATIQLPTLMVYC